MHSMAEWYMRGEQHDQGRLSRILDVAQDLKVSGCTREQLASVHEYWFHCDIPYSLVPYYNGVLIFCILVLKGENLNYIVEFCIYEIDFLWPILKVKLFVVMLIMCSYLQALSMLLNATPFAFVIDLACLASRREYLKLDKWLSDKIREHGVSFLQVKTSLYWCELLFSSLNNL